MLAEAMSSDKYDLISKLQQEGHTVAMTGDGINDGPALAAADLGVSVGSATDIAMEAADVVLMRNDLRDIITALHLSKATQHCLLHFNSEMQECIHFNATIILMILISMMLQKFTVAVIN